MKDKEKILVEIGSNECVYIEKLFGPMAAEHIRVHCDTETCEWVVERLNQPECLGHELYSPDDEHNNKCPRDFWEEKIRWDAQESFRNKESNE
jgi:hypothetical protein